MLNRPGGRAPTVVRQRVVRPVVVAVPGPAGGARPPVEHDGVVHPQRARRAVQLGLQL